MTVNEVQGRFLVRFPPAFSLGYTPLETVEGPDLFPRVTEYLESVSSTAVALCQGIARLSLGVLETSSFEIQREGLEWRNAVNCRFTTKKIDVAVTVARGEVENFYRFFLPISSAVQLDLERIEGMKAFNSILLTATLKKITLCKLDNLNVVNLFLDIKRTDPNWEELEIKDSKLTFEQMRVCLASTGTLKSLSIEMTGKLLPVLGSVWLCNLERLGIKQHGKTRLVDPQKIERCLIGHPSLKSYTYIGRDNKPASFNNEIGLILENTILRPVKGSMEDEIERIQESGTAIFKQVLHPFDPMNFEGWWDILRQHVTRIYLTGTEGVMV